MSFAPGALEALLPLALAWAFDAIHRDWPTAWHPVAWLGRSASAIEARLFEESSSPGRQLAAGTILVVLVVGLAVLVVAGLRKLMPSGPAIVVFEAMVLASTSTVSGLLRAAERMRAALDAENMSAARFALRSLCSRDPSTLDSEALAAGAIESVAENASDSWVAPLFFYATFGLIGAVVYRAVNTLDAMYGYRGRMEYFGKPSARLDDVLNFVPARLTALLLLLASRSRKRGWRIFLRDRWKTASPNAGQPMAMMAGLLGIRLEKAGHYVLGDANRPVTSEQIGDACRLVQRAGAMAAGGALVFVGWTG
ncbi:MAG: adenosylcobinamide-phosphate synthase CbiB [Myxococcota bacterium]